MVVSILLGIISWLLVLNYTNPKETRSFDVPLVVLNENGPASLGFSNTTSTRVETITVKASGRSDIIGNLTASDLYAAIDYSEITKVGVTSLSVSKPQSARLGITIEDYFPKTVDVSFDQLKQRNINVVVDYDNALLRDGYEYLSVTALPESVQISGFASEIDEIECIKINLSDSIPEDSIDSDRTGSFIGRYILYSGEDVTANYDTEKITVRIEVAKHVPITYTLSGTPHDDYYVSETRLSSATALLRGSAAELRNINSIDLGTIDVTGATENIVKRFSLSDYLPAEITSYRAGEIIVTTEILRYAVRSFLVDADSSVSTPGKDSSQYDYHITPSRFSVRVKGKEADLDMLSLAAIGPTLDVTSRGVGVYNIPLRFSGLDESKFTVLGEYVFNVVIRQRTVVTPTPDHETPTPVTPTPALPTSSPEPSGSDHPPEPTPTP